MAKTLAAGTTIYVYDALGQLSAEYGSAVTVAPCTTCYVSGDHLGSTRLLTDQSGNVVARHDFASFGQEVPAGYAGRTALWGSLTDVEQRFTGQVRDQETSEDFFNARYYYGGLTRFLSADPGNAGADVTNPQSWNGYGYALGNPLGNVDPTGMECVTYDNGSTGDDGTGTACPGSQTPDQIDVNGGSPGEIGTWNYAWLHVTLQSSPGAAGGSTTVIGSAPGKPGTNSRVPNKITCSTVLPNGRTAGSYANLLSNSINSAAQGNSVSTPYGPAPNPGTSGPVSVASQVYSGTNFKIIFRGRGNAEFLGDAGNFAYSAVSRNIGVPLSLTEAVAGGYALWAGHQDANGPFFMDASATVQVPAGYGAACNGY